MIKSKKFWYFLMIGAIVLYLLSIILGRYLFPGDLFLSHIFFIGLVILHIVEIPIVSLKIGKERGIPVLIIVINTLLYGFTWWLPLKMGIIDR